MSERDECTSVPTGSTVFTDFSCLCYYRGTVATDVTKGGKAAGKREITFSFTSNTGGLSVPCAILGLKGH